MTFKPSEQYERALVLVRAHIDFQNERFGHNRDLPALLWSTLISEESGEIARECIDNWQFENYQELQLTRIIEESVQLAAWALETQKKNEQINA